MSDADDPEKTVPGDTGAAHGHLPGEATPAQVPPVEIPAPPPFGLFDKGWTEGQWLKLVESFVTSKIATWKDIAAVVLGSLNPSQFGTSMASAEGFKRRYGKGNTMRIVMDWAYQQTGKCAECGTRLDLQADHVCPKETYENELDADFIENMVFRCRRCNVIRRPSHLLGGQTFLTAESALMWILFVIKPRTFEDFTRLCRLYGMTMADIRMEEAWAMAHWLAKEVPPAYGIEDDETGTYDLLVWEDNAVTRIDPGAQIPEGARRIFDRVPGISVFGFVAEAGGKVRFHEYAVSDIPFSTYDLGGREKQALAIKYVPPDREAKLPQRLLALPPRNLNLLAFGIREQSERFQLEFGNREEPITRDLAESSVRGTNLNIQPGLGLTLRAVVPRT